MEFLFQSQSEEDELWSEQMRCKKKVKEKNNNDLCGPLASFSACIVFKNTALRMNENHKNIEPVG